MKNKNRTYRGAGFSLVELMVVIAIIALFAALMIPTAVRAQAEPSYAPQIIGVPTVIQAGMTTNLITPVLIDCRKQQNIPIQMDASWSTPGDAAGANTNLVYTLAPTVDFINYDTNREVTLTAYNRQLTAGQNTCSVTNISGSGCAGYYILKIANNSVAGIATNKFTYGIKIGAP